MHMLYGEISSNKPEAMGTDKLCLRDLLYISDRAFFSCFSVFQSPFRIFLPAFCCSAWTFP